MLRGSTERQKTSGKRKFYVEKSHTLHIEKKIECSTRVPVVVDNSYICQISDELNSLKFEQNMF